MADESSKAKRGETREVWEAAIRLWAESGLSVREFCNREGLTEHTFYSWRRELMPENLAVEANQEPTAAEGGAVAANGRRQRRHRQGPYTICQSQRRGTVFGEGRRQAQDR